MKRFFSFLYITIITFFCACNNEVSQKCISPEQRELQMHQRLSSLKYKYGDITINGKKTIRRVKTENDDEENPNHTREEKVQIAKEDMEGFAIGGGLGLGFGAAVGSVVPGIGNGFGALCGGLIGGIVYAVVWSIDAANELQGDGTCSITRLYYIDSSNPIYSFSQPMELFDSSIECSNVGWMHNYIISSLHNDGQDSLLTLSHEEIIDYIFTTALSPIIGYENEYYALYEEIQDNIDNDYSTFNISDYDATIQLYFEDLHYISERFWHEYTEDFMQIVDDELSGYDDTRVMVINGCLSTFYYSRCLWNLNVPDVYSGTYLLFDVLQGEWEYITTEHIIEYYSAMLASGDILNKLIFVPRISNGVLTSLFLYDEISTLEYLPDNSYVTDVLESISMTLPNEYIIDTGNSQNLIFPSGIYPFQRFDEGYLIAID